MRFSNCFFNSWFFFFSGLFFFPFLRAEESLREELENLRALAGASSINKDSIIDWKEFTARITKGHSERPEGPEGKIFQKLPIEFQTALLRSNDIQADPKFREAILEVLNILIKTKTFFRETAIEASKLPLPARALLKKNAIIFRMRKHLD